MRATYILIQLIKQAWHHRRNAKFGISFLLEKLIIVAKSYMGYGIYGMTNIHVYRIKEELLSHTRKVHRQPAPFHRQCSFFPSVEPETCSLTTGFRLCSNSPLHSSAPQPRLKIPLVHSLSYQLSPNLYRFSDGKPMDIGCDD